MIKFGNDIVTVGGDWLKVIPKAVKIAEYPLQQIAIPKRERSEIDWHYQRIFNGVAVPTTDYAVLKVNCTEMQGSINLTAAQGSGWAEIDYTSRSPQLINCVNMWVSNLIAYDGRAGVTEVELANFHIIDRIIFDFINYKVYFYSASTCIAEGSLMSSESYTPWHVSLSNRSTQYPATCNVSGEIWQCFTMEQALSV